MGLFEFLMVLISVVIGLGLTELLTGAASLLRARESVRFHWIHILFQVGVFFALLQQWWESWDLNLVGEVGFFSVLILLSSPVFLFLITNLIYPREPEGADLQEYYYRQAPLLWFLVVAGTLVGTFLRPLIDGDPIFELANLSGIPMILICTILAISKNRRVHSVLAPTILILVVLDTVLANPVISGR